MTADVIDCEFTKQEAKLYLLMHHHGSDETDVSITLLFASLFDLLPDVEKYARREQQQRVGAIVSRVNFKMRVKRAGFKIEPGVIKHTYRLTRAG